MVPKRTQLSIAMVGALMLGFLFAGGVSAQEGSDADGFPLGAAAAYCEPGHLGPFVGCSPWEGVTVTFESADGSFSESCVTSGGERAAGCSMYVPFGSTITASIDPSVVPAGYYLSGEAAQVFEIPDGPPTGLYGGPVFELLPLDQDEDDVATDEPVVDDTGDADAGEVDELPKTGTGVANSGEGLSQVTPVLLIGAASLLMAGGVQLRRHSPR